MKLLIPLIGLLLLGACTDPRALTYVQTNAPRWNINPAMWNDNTLTTPPTLPSGIGPQAAR
jgi:uncharacterized lipoprotein YajG